MVQPGLNRSDAPHRVTISLGRGHHGTEIVRTLTGQNIAHRVIQTWPDLMVRAPGSDGSELVLKTRIGWFSPMVHVVWGLWRRMAPVLPEPTPQLWIDRVCDRIAARHLGQPDLLHAWSEISLHSMRTAHRIGARVVLEHPLLHVDLRRRLAEEETRTFGVRARECYGYVPEGARRRIRAEYAAADCIVLPSTAAVNSFAAAGENCQKLACVQLGVDHRCFRPAEGRTVPPARNFRVLFPARLELLKGLPYLLRAWEIAALPDAELVLAGNSVQESEAVLQSFSKRNVRILPHVPRNELTALYQSADVVVLPTLSDGFGLVLLEALACGVPVITTPNSGGPDCVEEGINGFIVPIRDAEAIAVRLQWLAAHHEEAAAMGIAGRRRVEQGFTLEHYSGRLLALYRSLYRSAAGQGS
jgi:alpha-maltose-1-phosphate synthase